MTMTGHIEAIVVAAGSSARMGAINKLLLPVAGVPLVRHCVALYVALAAPVTVVIGHEAQAVTGALAGLDVRLVENPGFADGQQASVAIGLAAAALAGRGLLIALADQPLLTAADIAALIAFFDDMGGTKICIPRHAGTRGNPIIFPTATARMLRDEPDAPGCRRYIDGHPEDVVWFEADDDHFTSDVDTPQDAARLLGIGRGLGIGAAP